MFRAMMNGSTAFAFAFTALLSLNASAQKDVDDSPARFLPPDVSIVVSVHDLGRRWNEISQTALVERLFELPQIKVALEDKKIRDLLKGQKFIEGLFSRQLPDLLQDYTQNGATLAWKGEKEFVLLFQPSADALGRLKQTLKEFASAAALGNANQGKAELFATTYRDQDAFGLDKARIGFANGWVVASSTSEFGKSVIDRVLGDKAKSIAEESWFQQATGLARSVTSANRPAITALINVQKLRPFMKLKTDRGMDAGKELLFGGILEAIDSAPVAAAIGDIGPEGAFVRIATPRPKASATKMEYFFGLATTESAPQPIDLPSRVLSTRWHRDVGLFWKMAPQIISDENALAGIAKAESDISTLFGGMVTVSDVFEYLGPDLELVAVRPLSQTAVGKLSMQIPAFGVAGNLRNVEKAQPALRLAFQQVVSFANLNAGAGKYPPLEVMTEREAGTTMISGSYFQMGDDTMYDNPAADLYKNFSPTLGFRGDRFVLASHRDLATQILNAPEAKPGNPSAQGHIDNTIIELWPAELALVGKLNREPLIAQRMLATGQERSAATTEVDTALELLKFFETARLRLLAGDDALVLEFDTRLAEAAAQTK